MKAKTTDRMDCIQVLRAIAAVAVVTHHMPLFGNGAWGVDLFFVISGFIMCYVTSESRDHFFIKRIIRIVPLYWAGTLGVFTVAATFPTLLKNTTADITHLLKSLAFIPFVKGQNGVHPVLFLGWTLNYEMLFYALFALSMAINHSYRHVICSVVLVALVVSRCLIDPESVIVAFYTNTILLEFVFGMVCYDMYLRTKEWHTHCHTTRLRICLSLVGVSLITCMPLTSVFVPITGRTIAWGILAALSFSFIIHSLYDIRLPRMIVGVGDASYSLYLFHPYVLQTFYKIFPAWRVHNAQAYLMAGLAIILCCSLSLVSYHFIEKPVTERLRSIFVRGQRSFAQLGAQADGPASGGPAGWLGRVCRAWPETCGVKVSVPGVRRAEGEVNGKGLTHII
jgi:exopolysaccharide production protein ExoZ